MATTLEKSTSNSIYLSIVQGSLRQSVPEGTPDSVKRDWEAGGEKGTKFELVYKAIVGKIVGVSFFDGDAGGRKFQNLNIRLEAGENGKTPVISVGVGTRYAQDILKKLPNVNFEEEVRFRPFAFVPEGEDKTVTGVEIMQRDGRGLFEKKINSFFHKKNAQGKWESVNGFPTPEGDTSDYTSDDWDIYYKQCRRFLVQYTKERVMPKFDEEVPASLRGRTTESETADDISPDDIPF